MIINQCCRLLNKNIFRKCYIHTSRRNISTPFYHNGYNFLNVREHIALLSSNRTKLRNYSMDAVRLEYNEAELDYYYEIIRKQISKNPTTNKDLSAYMHEIDDMTADLTELKQMLNDKDKEMAKMASNDICTINSSMYDKKLQILENITLNFKSLEDNVEIFNIYISPGVGGLEAALFSREMFDLYCSYCTRMQWPYTIQENVDSELGGIKKASLDINSKEAYSHLKFEGGIHRVQRCPVTERSGRMHTSTVSVFVLPVPTKIDMVLKESDLKYESKSGHGPGGQGINKGNSCARVTHLPTGIAYECQDERSLSHNTQGALRKLTMKLYSMKLEVERSNHSRERKIQIGDRGRSEKIRTYNFSQDRLTDHRITESVHNLNDIMSGGDNFHKLVMQLMNYSQKEQIRDIILNNLGKTNEKQSRKAKSR